MASPYDVVFTLSEAEWNDLQMRLDEPPRVLPRLAARLSEPDPWQD